MSLTSPLTAEAAAAALALSAQSPHHSRGCCASTTGRPPDYSRVPKLYLEYWPATRQQADSLLWYWCTIMGIQMSTKQFLHFRPEWHAALREFGFLPSVAWDLTGQVCCTRNVFHNCRRILPHSNQLVAGRRKARAMLQNSPRPPPASFDYESQRSSIIGTPKPRWAHFATKP